MAVAVPDLFTSWADGDAAAREEVRLEQALLRWRELGDAWGTAQMLNVLGDLARVKGDDVAATA